MAAAPWPPPQGGGLRGKGRAQLHALAGAATVAGNGVFNEATNEADLSWTESTAADLERYEVRGVAGPEYEADDEVILATVPAGGERVFSTSYALTAPGTSATFKIYVITATGNERGSNAVTVTRPS